MPLVAPVAPATFPEEPSLRGPSLFAKLRDSRPTGAWFGIFGFAALILFGAGLLLGTSLGGGKQVAAAPSASAHKPKRETAPAAVTPKAAESPKKASADEPRRSESKAAKGTFNQKAARAAIDRAAARAKHCRESGDPAGSASTSITFAPSGKVSDVTVTTARYANTKVGRCIVARLSEARVPEFTGNPVTLKKSVSLR
jgi:hypothetical protein